MKQLQNNFTTPRQSKRLMELGVPADSADCYYTDRRMTIWHRSEFDKVDWSAKVGDDLFYLPCWSVGRLMEILSECYMTDMQFRYFRFNHLQGGMVDSLVQVFEHFAGEIDYKALD